MNPISQPTPFYFLRHGETDWNKESRVMGQVDIPLNATGLAQAYEAAQRMAECEITSIAASPLARALRTAEIIAHALDKPITIIDELKECHWGAVQGQLSNPNSFLNWSKGIYADETGEKKEAFIARVICGLQKAMTLPGPILIVAHSGTHWALRQQFQLPHMEIDHCTPILHQPLENDRWHIENELEKFS